MSLPDPLGYATVLVAILAAGRVVVPLDPAAPPAEVSRILAAARPDAAVSGAAGPDLEVLGQRHDPVQPRPGQQDAPVEGERGRAGGIYLCTSGTTGTPKGILLREDQLGHVAAAVATHHRLSPGDRGYCCLPLFHINAEVVGLLATLTAGACLVVDRKFSRRGFWALIEQQEITWVNAVPAIITVLALDPPVIRQDPLARRVRFVRSASAPLPAFGAAAVRGGLRHPRGRDLRHDRGGQHDQRQPAGRAAQGRLGRPAGRLAGPGGPGGRRTPPAGPGAAGGPGADPGPGDHHAVRGRRPAGAFDPEGWLDTGDLGYLDADGYLFLAGRSDDVINRGGEKIYPREIEDVLLAQPGVGSAAVVAAPDEVLGQRPVAYVVPAGSWPADQLEQAHLEELLHKACEAALPRPKQPSEFCLVPELPVGPTGKVSRRRLRETASRTPGLR